MKRIAFGGVLLLALGCYFQEWLLREKRRTFVTLKGTAFTI